VSKGYARLQGETAPQYPWRKKMDKQEVEIDESVDEELRCYQDRLTCGLYEAIYDLDDASRDTVMKRQAQTCVAAFLDLAGLPTPMDLDSFRRAMRDAQPIGAEIRKEGNVLHWTQNQRNQCVCPLVQRRAVRLDPKLCVCSAYWVRYLFEEIGHTPVRVEIVETVARGGQTCRFKITPT
jgi:hypothetical protein